jgi:hypothetical protein
MFSKTKAVRDCFFNGAEADLQLYAWRMEGTDVKLIFAVDDESAARIAVRARIDLCEMSEEDALFAVKYKDALAPVDVHDVLYQGEAPLWDGAEPVGPYVEKV